MGTSLDFLKRSVPLHYVRGLEHIEPRDLRRAEFSHHLCKYAAVNQGAHTVHHPVQRRETGQFALLQTEVFHGNIDEIRRITITRAASNTLRTATFRASRL